MDKKILVVEDELAVQKLFVRILAECGYDVKGVDCFDAALQAMAETGFDLVISDIMLGGKSGLDLLKVAQERGCDAYFVLITGFPSLAAAQDALRHGAFDFLTKPVSKEALMRTARTVLQHKAVRDEKEQMRANLEAIFNSVQDAIITVDAGGTLLQINEPATDLCGIQPAHIGTPLAALLDSCCRHCVKILNQVVSTQQRVEPHKIVCPKRGRPAKVFTVSASPLQYGQGGCSGAVMVFKDETQLVAMERALAERRQLHRLIGSSASMRAIFSLIEDLADVETTVLITGETGTGKELVADAIHNQGRRKEGAFVRVNCAALTETLLESELFGHVRGAFTGALQERVGRFQLADKGTLFLDEIGDISPGMQVRLLRVLQERQFERVGDTKTIDVDVRVIAATNHDLQKRIAEGRFREDLYYRLKVVEIHIPPLRDRRDDIPLMLKHFIQRFNIRFKKQIEDVSEPVLQICMNYGWPGNIRELEHVVEHAFVVCRTPIIELHHLPVDFQQMSSPVATRAASIPPPDSEEASIRQALLQTNWRREEAARLLEMSRSTFFRKMRQYGISRG
ncbi:MAG: sigma 54-interacting transcriptional regulator [Magnetococcales bacterium]|nr:sigma 54-interacting transcriptional regulator [Magnetococcales bacterium]